jgi:hypothetical protein
LDLGEPQKRGQSSWDREVALVPVRGFGIDLSFKEDTGLKKPQEPVSECEDPPLS